MAKSERRLSVTMDDDIEQELDRLRPRFGEQRVIVNTALRRYLFSEPGADEPQDAEERALVQDALDLHRALAAHGKADVLTDLIKTVRKTLGVP